MENAEVIEEMDQGIDDLNERVDELMALLRNPGGPPAERADRLAAVREEINTLSPRILGFEEKRIARIEAQGLGEAVPPLSEARVESFQEALETVSQSIADTATFRAAIELAGEISEATTQANRAVGTV